MSEGAVTALGAASSSRRRFLVPEVVQTNAMDCGPASLKCMLEGFGIDVALARLREACQTSVDGTSVDVIEDLAVQLGLDAEQVLSPTDHVPLAEADLLPALAIVKLPHIAAHFVVVWRRHGSWLQIMDPSSGRRWVRCEALLAELYQHTTRLPAAVFRDWAGGEAFLRPLDRRLSDLGIGRKGRARLIDSACADPSWRALAGLDASTRMVTALLRAGAIDRGPVARALVERLASTEPDEGSIPAGYWSARPARAGAESAEHLLVRGAVLVTVRGRGGGAARLSALGPRPAATQLSSEMLQALREPTPSPWAAVRAMLAEDGWRLPLGLASATAVSAVAVGAQAILFRGLLDLGRSLGVGVQRLTAMSTVVVFVLALALVHVPIASGLARVGRRLELRLRAALFEKIPRIADRYFHSLLVSDLAHRAHAAMAIRALPTLVHQALSVALSLLFTLAGVIWLDPASAPIAAFVVLAAALFTLGPRRWLAERDLRVQNHAGALTRFYLDALLGIWCVRAHGAQASVAREQEGLLVHWSEAQLAQMRSGLMVDAAQSLVGTGLSAALLFGHLSRSGSEGSVLLFAFWALQLPNLARVLVLMARSLPAQRNVMVRLLEPLNAPEEPAPPRDAELRPERRGPNIRFADVGVRAGGHSLLEAVSFEIPKGSHVAIVGESGAGKSTLVGLLLGWHRPETGTISIDGEDLTEAKIALLRAQSAWVDPAVTLWNRRLVDNLLYGSGASADAAREVGWAIDRAELRDLLERLPEGLQTELGEGGALVSGGEGQRVRLGRAMLRRGVRLAILDEPFRGLDRDRRRRLLRRARELWKDATMFCVTHDVGETLRFERVLVVEQGRVVEDGDPAHLAADPTSRYAAMLEADHAVREGLWSSAGWRRLRIDRGRLRERGAPLESEAPDEAPGPGVRLPDKERAYDA